MKVEVKTEEIQVEKAEIVTLGYEEHTTIDVHNVELVDEKIIEDEPRRQRWVLTFKPVKYPSMIIANHQRYIENEGWNEYFTIYVWLGDKWVVVNA